MLYNIYIASLLAIAGSDTIYLSELFIPQVREQSVTGDLPVAAAWGRSTVAYNGEVLRGYTVYLFSPLLSL